MKPKQKFPPRPSTRAFYKEGKGIPSYKLFDFIHGYVYARWPYLYIGVGTGEHPLTRLFQPVVALINRISPISDDGNLEEDTVTFADTYHGKVVPPQAAAGLVKIEEEITLEDLEPIIPYARARDIVMKNPQHIVALECPCRVSRADPCLPLDVCLIIGDPFASFIREHHPQRSRRITQTEAVEILEAEHERGHVHHAFFKDAMLERFYAICNCCSCCCGAMQAQRTGTLMLTASGYLCHVDQSLCEGCGVCEEICPFDAIEINNKISIVIEEACMGCGICVDHCQEGALRLERDPRKGVPLEIHNLMEEALM
ncbi:MAG: Caffeyl-CoA reductase-Etf complex subunit CarE [Chloroflexi bacterium]|nr:Caffeyl-CoA reductase-Etf complex subunit CarE [Chloroflexota bacterium]